MPIHPNRRPDRRPNRLRAGFTLIELLVVIAIIGVLVSILIPIVGKVKIAGYNAATEQEISQLTSAINEYYGTFHAYPGPFSNDALEPATNGLAAGFMLEIYNPSDPAAVGGYITSLPAWNASTGSVFNVTASENLVLGLCGGLDTDPANGNLAFRPDEVGSGPLDRNAANPKHYSAFMTTDDLEWCYIDKTTGTDPSIHQSAVYPSQANTASTFKFSLSPFADAGGVVHGNDGPMPEFVDRFPSPGPMPILYYRARVGAPGIVSDGFILKNGAIGQSFASYQYDLRDNAGYTYPYPSGATMGTSIGLSPVPLSGGSNHVMHCLTALGATQTGANPTNPALPSPLPIAAKGATNDPDALWYFMNPSINPTATDTYDHINYSGRPRAVDSFILIAAGPDGIYGTADDITSFGTVLP